MSGCCDPTTYRRFFNSKEAARNLRNYRRRGLDSMAKSMVGYLATTDLDEALVLEVGGGIGAIQVELLRAGVARTTNVELSGGYEETARQLAEAEGFAGRASRHVGDFVEVQGDIEDADIVVMNRVVCCYPWMNELMTAAAGKAGRFLALTFPRDRWWIKTALRLGNGYMAARRCDFRSFVHSPAAIEGVAVAAGFVTRHSDETRLWKALVMERAA